MYKLFATDIDGTLIDDDFNVPSQNVEAINRLKECGILPIIASGRPYFSVQRYMEELDLHGPTIAFDGSRIIDSDTLEILYDSSLSKEEAQNIWNFATQENLTITIWSGETLFTNKIDKYSNMYNHFWKINLLVLSDITEAPTWNDDKIKSGVYRIVFPLETEIAANYYKTLNPKNFGDVRIANLYSHNLAFTPHNSSKGHALKFVAEKLGFTKEQVIAIGDEGNDIPMIRYAGLGIAMENSPENVKESADYVTTSNVDGGLAHALNKKVFCEQ